MSASQGPSFDPTTDGQTAEGERVEIRIRRGAPARRLDKYLHGRYPHFSRTQIQKLIKQGDVTVNGEPSKASYDLRGGDVIALTVPSRAPIEIVPEDIPLNIVFEDEYLIAINKQAGIVCHPGHPAQTGTIVNALVHYSEHLSQCTDVYRPGIVHRLDKFTTGIMLVAKTDEAHWRLARQFEQRTVQKTYLAVVEGEMQLDGDTIDAPISVHPVVRERFAVLVERGKINIGRNAVTHYEVAERFRGYTLVRLFPKTGRTHQLRVHMSHIGHPIVGDTMYGGALISEMAIAGEGSDAPIFEYQALHAWRIEFVHPITEQPMTLEAEFHQPLRQLVQLLRRHRSV